MDFYQKLNFCKHSNNIYIYILLDLVHYSMGNFYIQFFFQLLQSILVYMCIHKLLISFSIKIIIYFYNLKKLLIKLFMTSLVQPSVGPWFDQKIGNQSIFQFFHRTGF